MFFGIKVFIEASGERATWFTGKAQNFKIISILLGPDYIRSAGSIKRADLNTRYVFLIAIALGIPSSRFTSHSRAVRCAIMI